MQKSSEVSFNWYIDWRRVSFIWELTAIWLFFLQRFCSLFLCISGLCFRFFMLMRNWTNWFWREQMCFESFFVWVAMVVVWLPLCFRLFFCVRTVETERNDIYEQRSWWHDIFYSTYSPLLWFHFDFWLTTVPSKAGFIWFVLRYFLSFSDIWVRDDVDVGSQVGWLFISQANGDRGDDRTILFDQCISLFLWISITRLPWNWEVLFLSLFILLVLFYLLARKCLALYFSSIVEIIQCISISVPIFWGVWVLYFW